MALSATSRARMRVLLIIIASFAALATSFWLGTKSGYRDGATSARETKGTSGSGSETSPPISAVPNVSPAETTPSPGGTPPADSSAVVAPSPQASESPGESILSGSFVGTLKLIIPVAGVKPEQLQDTFTDARSEGRVHDAIDIMAPAGTPVLAASDGEIVRLFQSERGGTTIYQLSPDKKLVFYYAHLQRYADGVVAGKFVRQGELIAYVGDTGNAGAGNYHLHFSIAVLADPKRYWEGKNINPYPLLR